LCGHDIPLRGGIAAIYYQEKPGTLDGFLGGWEIIAKQFGNEGSGGGRRRGAAIEERQIDVPQQSRQVNAKTQQ
jgi:hypothetical protein